MRSSRSFGGAAESITARKRGRLIATARHYLSQQIATPACRFDAVLIEHDGAPEWIKDVLGELSIVVVQRRSDRIARVVTFQA